MSFPSAALQRTPYRRARPADTYYNNWSAIPIVLQPQKEKTGHCIPCWRRRPGLDASKVAGRGAVGTAAHFHSADKKGSYRQPRWREHHHGRDVPAACTWWEADTAGMAQERRARRRSIRSSHASESRFWRVRPLG